METLTGRDSSMIKDMITEETSNVDWARLLLDERTDDVIINVSREKIAHELIRLKTEIKHMKANGNSSFIDEAANSEYRNNHNFSGPKSHNSLPATYPSIRDLNKTPNTFAVYGHTAKIKGNTTR